MMLAPTKLKKEVLRALFDDEGSVINNKGRGSIRLYSVNLKGLKQIQRMLSEFNIDSKITPGYGHKRNVFAVIVQDLNKFKTHIGFNLKRKQNKLESFL